MQTILDNWKKHNQEIDKIFIEAKGDQGIDFVNHGYFAKFLICPLIANTKNCIKQIEIMLRYLGKLDNIDILEVGGGYGNLCRNLHEKIGIKSYTMLDTESMLRFAKKFLQHFSINCDYKSSEEFQKLFGKKFDLFISTICLSELTEEYRESLVENIFPNCKMLFVVDANSESQWPDFGRWLENSVKKYFDKIEIIKATNDNVCSNRNHSLYIGIKTL